MLTRELVGGEVERESTPPTSLFSTVKKLLKTCTLHLQVKETIRVKLKKRQITQINWNGHSWELENTLLEINTETLRELETIQGKSSTQPRTTRHLTTTRLLVNPVWTDVFVSYSGLRLEKVDRISNTTFVNRVKTPNGCLIGVFIGGAFWSQLVVRFILIYSRFFNNPRHVMFCVLARE